MNMDINAIIDEWSKEFTVYLHYIREMKASEYNIGYADGIESAINMLHDLLQKVSGE
ncbi:MAG: hypothetical protein K6U74_15805 [Firmicutes bacterium]|nr:hypothetical protein [Bacillota bacterium]